MQSMLVALFVSAVVASAPANACPRSHYTNTAGECVKRPAVPKAVCVDGYVSYARSYRGICRGHGGVWWRAKDAGR